MATAYPLTWPPEWPRTKSRLDDRCKTSLHQAITNVEESLRRFAKDSDRKVEGMIVSSNFSLTDRRPADPSVAVYFTWDGISTCIAVDRYKTIEANLQAVHHCIEAERTKLRHGGLNIVKAAFRGYAALPPPSTTRPAGEILGLKPGSAYTRADIETIYREKAKAAHPDAGGSHAAMADLNAARDEMLRSIA